MTLITLPSPYLPLADHSQATFSAENLQMIAKIVPRQENWGTIKLLDENNYSDLGQCHNTITRSLNLSFASFHSPLSMETGLVSFKSLKENSPVWDQETSLEMEILSPGIYKSPAKNYYNYGSVETAIDNFSTKFGKKSFSTCQKFKNKWDSCIKHGCRIDFFNTHVKFQTSPLFRTYEKDSPPINWHTKNYYSLKRNRSKHK